MARCIEIYNHTRFISPTGPICSILGTEGSNFFQDGGVEPFHLTISRGLTRRVEGLSDPEILTYLLEEVGH